MAIVDYLILAALSEEWRTARKILLSKGVHAREQVVDSLTYHLWPHPIRMGEPDRKYLIAARPIWMKTPGQTRAGLVTTEAVNAWKPKHLLLFGIAGSLAPDTLKLGDVVVPTDIFGYEVNAADSTQTTPPHRPSSRKSGSGARSSAAEAQRSDRGWRLDFRQTGHQSSVAILDRIAAFRDSDEYTEWQRACAREASKMKLDLGGRPVQMHFSAMASGNTVVRSVEFAQELRQQIDKRIDAVEMEALGVFQSIDLIGKGLDVLMVRGISDYADKDKSELEKRSNDNWRAFAAGNAARLLSRLLQRAPSEPVSPPYELDLTRGEVGEVFQDIRGFFVKREGVTHLFFPRLLVRQSAPQLKWSIRLGEQGKPPGWFKCLLRTKDSRALVTEVNQEARDGIVSFSSPAANEWFLVSLVIAHDMDSPELVVKCEDEFGRFAEARLHSHTVPAITTADTTIGDTAEAVLNELRNWREALSSVPGVDRVYVFGSLVYRDGAQFTTEQSDIDLLIRFSEGPQGAEERVHVQQALVPHLIELEKSLRRLLPSAPEKPLVSVSLLAAAELDNNIHKDDKPGFWRSTKFVEITPSQILPIDLARNHAETFKVQFLHAVQVLRDVQHIRNQYLRSSWDDRAKLSHDSDPLPKKLLRSAASLRFFIERTDEAATSDVHRGLAFLLNMLERAARTTPTLGKLWDRVSAQIGRGPKTPLSLDDQLLLWELIADEAWEAIVNARRAARSAPPWRPVVQPAMFGGTAGLLPEETFLTRAAGPSLRLGSFDLACKLFPETQWNSTSPPEVFEDDPEAERRLEFSMVEQRLPADLLGTLIQEIKDELRETEQLGQSSREDYQALGDVLSRLMKEGSNAYPRLVAPPEIQDIGEEEKSSRVLHVYAGPSRYGIALVEERRLHLPTALRLRRRHILNSLAVRMAYIAKLEGEWWVEFHQRHSERNATYRGAWDIGASGYIDEQAHRDPADTSRISPWQTAAHEIAEELGIGSYQLPHRDKYRFFGVGRNDPTGQLDLLGFCEGISLPSEQRRPSPRVSTYARCRLTPKEMARFIVERRYWVPTALLTALLTLRHFGFSHEELKEAFGGIGQQVNLMPF